MTGDTIRLNPGIPIIRIFDVAKAEEFYLDFLGFKQDWEHRFEPGMPLYAQVSRSGLILHLSEHHGDASPGATVFIEMKGIEALHRELLGKRYGYARPGLEQAPWGRELQLADPFGNRRASAKGPDPAARLPLSPLSETGTGARTRSESAASPMA